MHKDIAHVMPCQAMTNNFQFIVLCYKNFVHYFSEARYHGAAYYSFSRNEEERRKQQEELNKLREETKKQQESISELKKMREKQMAARLKAARNRKRVRMGLPSEPDELDNAEDKTSSNEEQLIDTTNTDEKEKEAEEKQKQIERSKILRPWDIGKEIMKQHYEYSQEEWVKIQREQRPKEFAPPSSYSNFYSKIDDDYEPENKRLFFTTKTKKSKQKVNESNTSNSDATEQSSSKYDPRYLEDSVMAGLRYLREQTEKTTK